MAGSAQFNAFVLGLLRAEPFAPMGPGTKSMNYFAVPARLYDEPEELSVWLARALHAARASAGKPRERRA